MDREDWMYLKALAPGFALVVAAAIAMWMLSGLRSQSGLGAALFDTLRWGPLAMAAAGTGIGFFRCYRTYQALNGAGLICHCGGPLGGEVDGRYGPYRKCMSCQRNLSHKHWD